MEDWPWTAIGTLVALALGLLSIVFGYWLPHVRERATARRAELEVRYECYWRRDLQSGAGREGGLQDRLVIKNHGPHVAHDVDVVSLVGAEGQAMRWEDGVVTRVLPAGSLQPRQEHHCILEWTVDDPRPGQVTLRWRDGEGRHERPYALSPQYV